MTPLTRREADLLGRARKFWQAQAAGDAAGELRSLYAVLEALRRPAQDSTDRFHVVES